MHKNENSEIIQMPKIEDYINAIKSPQDNLHKLKRFRPFINFDGSMDFWFDENCIVFHMIDSLQDNYDFGLECCLTNKYFIEQRELNLYAPKDSIRIYENELNVPLLSKQTNLYPVILHKKYQRRQNSHRLIQQEDDEFVISKDGKTLLCWNRPSGKIGKGFTGTVVPEGVEVISDGVFAGCENLIYIDLPKSLKRIGRGAFADCGNIEIIFGSKHIDYIDEYAFWQCHFYLNKYWGRDCLPETIGSFHDTAFKDTVIHHNQQEFLIWLAKRNGIWNFRIIEKSIIEKMEGSKNMNDIFLPDDNTFDDTFEDENGVVYDKSLRFVLKCNNSTLNKYKFKTSAIGIFPHSFEGLKQLEEIDLSNVEFIGDYAFAYCDRLTSIIGGDCVRQIGEYSFHFSGLEYVFIPKTVSHIGKGAFANCVKLRSVEILSSIEKIEENVFRDCKSLTSAVIPNSVVTIERLAFGNCISLKNIVLPNKLGKIGELAFCNCAFEEIRLPHSLLVMDYSPFSGCRETKIHSESPFFYANKQFLLGYNKTRLISYLADETNIVVPGTVKVILGYSLTNKNRNAKIFLPDSVKYIGHWAFRYASAKQINFPKSIDFVKTSFDYYSSIRSFIIAEKASNIINDTKSNPKIIRYNEENELIQEE